MLKPILLIVRLVVFFPLVFGTFHLFIFYCWYFRNIALEIPFIIGAMILLAMSLRFRRFLPLDLRHPRKELEPLAVSSSIVEILAWYTGMILLYSLLYLKFEFPSSLENETWRPVAIGYSLYFVGIFVAVSLYQFTFKSSKIIYRDLCKVARVIPRISSVLFIYILVDLIFTLVFRIISLVCPDSFDRPLAGFVDSLYFSTVTITTLGYGEIHAANNLTKLLVSLETLLGITLLAAVLATAISVAISEGMPIDNDIDKKDMA